VLFLLTVNSSVRFDAVNVIFRFLQYENQVSILGNWTNKGPTLSRPKWSDATGKVCHFVSKSSVLFSVGYHIHCSCLLRLP